MVTNVAPRLKRPNGGGSIYQRKDGRWVTSIRRNGKRIAKYSHSEQEARAWLGVLTSKDRHRYITTPARIMECTDEGCSAVRIERVRR